MNMRANQLLSEAGSRGLFLRSQQGSVFTSKEGQTISAIGNAVFPPDGTHYENDTVNDLPVKARKLPPVEQKKLLRTGQQKLMMTLSEYQKANRIDPRNWNVVNVNGRAALITLWKNSRNELVAFVKLYNIKSMGAIPFFWSNSDFARDTGYSIQDNVQQKNDLNLKPSTVVGTGEEMGIDEIVEQVSVNINAHTELSADVRYQVVQLIKNVEGGFSTPVANAAAYATSYEIDLGETAAPIALLTGHFVSGAYREVEEQLLKSFGASWRKIQSISYPMSDRETLVDSYLNLKNNTQIGISSKDGKGGAAASITSLTSAIETNPERYEDMVAEKKYKYLFNIMKLLKEKSAEEGPLELGVIYKVITKDEKEEIKRAINDPNLDKKHLSEGLKKLIKDPIYNPITTNQNYTVGYHLLTVVAHTVTEKFLNKNSNLVTAFFKEILSRSNMIQVKTSVKKVGNDALFSNFNVIWPPSFSGQVKFFSRKNYSASSRPGGKICFLIK
jgi:hypothetical protein